MQILHNLGTYNRTKQEKISHYSSHSIELMYKINAIAFKSAIALTSFTPKFYPSSVLLI